MFNRLKVTWSCAAIAVAASLTCGNTASAQEETIKIAAPFGLTGPVGPFAEPYVPALELAIKYINDNGAIKINGECWVLPDGTDSGHRVDLTSHQIAKLMLIGLPNLLHSPKFKIRRPL